MKNWSIYVTNATIHQGHFQQVLRSQENQLDKVGYTISHLGKYDKREDTERNAIYSGEGRTGRISEGNVWNFKGADLRAFFHKWDRTPRFKIGDTYFEESGGGNKIPGLNRLYAAIRENVNTAIDTSSPKSEGAEFVRGQLKGINLGDKRFPDFRRRKSQKEKFIKKYGEIDPEMQIRVIPGREETLADLDETLSLAPSGNAFETSLYLVKKNEALTYEKTKNDPHSIENIGKTFMQYMEETEKGLRDGLPQILEQRDNIEKLYEDICKKKLVIINANGPVTSQVGSMLEMRGGQGGIEQIIHIDPASEAFVDLELNKMTPEQIKKDVSMITISESLGNDSLRKTKKYMAKGIEPYILSSNREHEIAKENSDNFIYIPNEPVHVLGSGHKVSNFHQLALITDDGISSILIKEKKSWISKTHKVD